MPRASMQWMKFEKCRTPKDLLSAKINFSKNKYRTTHLNRVLALLVGKNGDFKGLKKAKVPQKARLPIWPPLLDSNQRPTDYK